MIRLVRGTIVSSGKDYVVVDIGGGAGGLGVKVFVAEAHALAANPGDQVTYHTYLQVREDALNLFGFGNEDELSMFELLLAVNGVGPKVALATLSVLTPDALRMAVTNEEPAMIARVPGIGKRTAEKIVLDLRDKVKGVAGLAALPPSGNADAEVVDALIALGYSVVEAQRAVQRVPKDVEGVEERLRVALSQFNQ